MTLELRWKIWGRVAKGSAVGAVEAAGVLLSRPTARRSSNEHSVVVPSSREMTYCGGDAAVEDGLAAD